MGGHYSEYLFSKHRLRYYITLNGKRFYLTKHLGRITLPFLGNRFDVINLVIDKFEKNNLLSKIECIVLRRNDLDNIPDLSKFTSLTAIEISDNYITNMSPLETLPYPGRVTYLNLNDNKIQKIESLANFTHLNTLILNKNEIALIENINHLARLKTLNLADNNIKIMQNLENLYDLQLLNFHDNYISEISGLDDLKNLRFLDLSDNEIAEMNNLESISNIYSINLAKNYIQEIKGLFLHTQLFKLSLYNNPVYLWAKQYFNGTFNLSDEIPYRFKHPQKIIEYCHKLEYGEEKVAELEFRPFFSNNHSWLFYINIGGLLINIIIVITMSSVNSSNKSHYLFLPLLVLMIAGTYMCRVSIYEKSMNPKDRINKMFKILEIVMPLSTCLLHTIIIPLYFLDFHIDISNVFLVDILVGGVCIFLLMFDDESIKKRY